MSDNFDIDMKSSTRSINSTIDLDAPIIQMSKWKPEDWSAPVSFSDFPILEICPEAPELFAEAGHFTPRDLRAIVSKFSLPVDHKDPIGVYRILLKVTQSRPWIFPVIESVAVENRGQQGGQRNKKKSVSGHVMSKMPLWKLRLSSQPDLQDRVDELRTHPVDPALAVAAFAEYAIVSFMEISRGTSMKSLTEEARGLFAEKLRVESAADVLDEVEPQASTWGLGALDEVTDWSGHADRLLAYVKDHPDETSQQLYQHAIEAARALASEAGPHSSPADLTRIGRVFCLAGELAELLEAPRRDEVVEQLIDLGFEVDGEALSDEAVEVLCSALNAGLDAVLHDFDQQITSLEKEASDVKARIARAVEDENYTELKELSAQAEAVKTSLGEVTAVRTDLGNSVRKALSGDFENREALLSDLAAFIPDLPAPSSVGTPEDEAGEEPRSAQKPEVTEENVRSDEDRTGNGASSETSSNPVRATHADQRGQQEPAQRAPVRDQGAQDEEEPPGEGASDQADRVEIEPGPDTLNDTAPEDTEDLSEDAPVPAATLANLIDRGLLGVAFDAAFTFEKAGTSWPISAAALQAAAASRAAQRDYGADTQRFMEITTAATTSVRSDLTSSMLLGALLRPAMSNSASGFRSLLPDLCRGAVGQHLIKAADAISELDYDFPPDPDELARLSGSQSKPQKQRITEKLEAWRHAVSARSSRWHFATSFMHHVVSDTGLIGAAVVAIREDRSNAAELAQQAINALSSTAKIGVAADEFAKATGRTTAGVHSNPNYS